MYQNVWTTTRTLSTNSDCFRTSNSSTERRPYLGHLSILISMCEPHPLLDGVEIVDDDSDEEVEGEE